jgi:RNA polymerase sigma factor (sigma-70 family)
LKVDHVDNLSGLVGLAQAGDLEAFGRLIGATPGMVHAVAFSVLRDAGLAQDAAQDAYLRAFRRIGDLAEPGGFIRWLRRIVITVALNTRRARRHTLLRLDDVEDVPVLDEAETTWSELQRQRLGAALLTLNTDERRLCDRRYHGRWTTSQLATAAGVDESTMRKRLQRVRDKLRREIGVADLLDDHGRLDQWRMTSTVLQSVDRVLPGRAVKIVPTQYAMCKQAWELAVEDAGQWLEILAWGVFTDEIVAHVGGDPERQTAIGVGYGLERLAMIRYGIDDIRKIEATHAA